MRLVLLIAATLAFTGLAEAGGKACKPYTAKAGATAVEELGAYDAKVRAAALERLNAWGAKAAPEILTALETGGGWSRDQLFELLVRANVPGTGEKLIAIGDKSAVYNNPGYAYNSAAKIDGDRVFDALITRFVENLEKKDERRAWQVANGLGVLHERMLEWIAAEMPRSTIPDQLLKLARYARSEDHDKIVKLVAAAKDARTKHRLAVLAAETSLARNITEADDIVYESLLASLRSRDTSIRDDVEALLDPARIPPSHVAAFRDQYEDAMEHASRKREIKLAHRALMLGSRHRRAIELTFGGLASINLKERTATYHAIKKLARHLDRGLAAELVDAIDVQLQVTDSVFHRRLHRLRNALTGEHNEYDQIIDKY